MTSPREAQPDVVIVGGGLSGLLMADRLGRRGLHCVVLEAGPSLSGTPPENASDFDAAVKDLLRVDGDAWRFRSIGLPYEWTRVRALGGRSLLWGGWCERMDAQNICDAQALDSPWPITLDELAPYYRIAERKLHVRTSHLDPFFHPVKTALGLVVESKRVAVLASQERVLCGLDLPQRRIRCHAVALRLHSTDGCVRRVEFVDAQSGKVSYLAAKAFVLCASPVETARLLLDSDLTQASDQVGGNLVDHLVASCLAILPYPAPRMGPPSPLERSALIPRFVNLPGQPARDYRSGFSVELRGPLPLTELGKRSIEELGIPWREANELSYCLVHAIGEAHPHPKRFVTLKRDQQDSFGRPIPLISLAWSDEQKRMAADMNESVAAVADALSPPGSRIIGLRDPLLPGGIAHEAGVARMAVHPQQGVVGPRGAVFGTGGLYVADASIQPTGLDRHPTLTLMALTLRIADAIWHDIQDC